MRIALFKNITWGKVLAFPLTVGASFALGAMAFSGMMLITSSWVWGLVAFIFAVAVEPEVYWQNIMEAVENIQVGEARSIKRGIARRRLEELMTTENLPLKYHLYSSLRISLKKLRSGHGHHEAAARIEQEIYALEEKYFEDALSRTHAQELKNRLRLFKLFHVLTAASAVSMGLTVLYICYAQIAAVAVLSSVFTSGVIIPIAILAGLGYAMMMHKTACIVVAEDALAKCWKKVKSLFQQKEGEPAWLFYLRSVFSAVGVAALLVLVAFATIATAGTCWVLTIRGATIVGDIVEKGARLISWIVSILMAIPTFLFSLTSAFRSILQWPHQIKDGVRAFKSALKRKKEKENWVQLINPFFWIYALVALVWKGAIYIGHVLSVGLTADRLPGVNYILSGISAALLEFLQDFWSFLPHHKESNGSVEDNNVDDDHMGHSHHLDIAGKLLIIVTFPLVCLTILVDALAGRWSARAGEGYETFSQAFVTAWKKSFPSQKIKPLPEALGPKHYKDVESVIEARQFFEEQQKGMEKIALRDGALRAPPQGERIFNKAQKIAPG